MFTAFTEPTGAAAPSLGAVVTPLFPRNRLNRLPMSMRRSRATPVSTPLASNARTTVSATCSSVPAACLHDFFSSRK